MDLQIIPSIQTLTSIKNTFLSALQTASDGKPSSLAFIRNELPSFRPDKTVAKRFQVFSIGGSVFEKAEAIYENGEIVINNFQRLPLPLITHKEVLLNLIEAYLDPSTDLVGINFAYPMEPVKRGTVLDGKLIKGAKDHTFDGLVGELIGRELEEHIYKKTGRKIHISLANDTVCLVLAGLVKYGWKSLAGGIVGTGMNFGLFLEEDTVVNLEAGDFKDFELSEAATFIDGQSANKGHHLFEKEVAGGYLYQIYNFYLKKNNLKHKELNSSEELTKLAYSNDETSAVAQEVFEKSAAYIACQIAGMYEFKKTYLNFIMEGSVFWKGYKYKVNVENYLRLMGVPTEAIQFFQIDQSTVKGAACLALR
jgi:hexokinase